MEITKKEIEQFKKDCKARGLKLPSPCTDEWCIEQIEDIQSNVWSYILGFKDSLDIGELQ